MVGITALLIERSSEREFHHQKLGTFAVGSRNHCSRRQCLAQFRQFLGVSLDRLGAAIQLIVIPAQVLGEQIQQGAKTMLCVAVVWISCVIQWLKGSPVARLPVDQLTAAAGHHPAGLLHGGRRHHQANRLQVAEPFLMRLQLRIHRGRTSCHGYPLIGQR